MADKTGWGITREGMRFQRDGCRHLAIPGISTGYIGWCLHNCHGYPFFLGSVMFLVDSPLGGLYLLGWMKWVLEIRKEEKKRAARLGAS